MSAKHMAGIAKPATLHTLRHSFAARVLEANANGCSGSSRSCSGMPS